MKQRRRAYSRLQYAVSNVLCVLLTVAAIAAAGAAAVWLFNIFQPRMFGTPAEAQAVRYSAERDGDDAAKTVEYTFEVGDRQYRGTQEVGSTAYDQRTDQFTVWYMPDNPAGAKYISIRDHWETVAAVTILAMAIALTLMPRIGRKIDAAIENGERYYVVKGCVCGVSPSLKLQIDNTSRRSEQMRLLLLSALLPLALFCIITEITAGIITEAGIAILILAGIILYPVVKRFFLGGADAEIHTLRCQVRRAWWESING